MSGGTLVIAGDFSDGDADRWARSTCGLVDFATLEAHVQIIRPTAPLPRWCEAILAVGRDAADLELMPHPGVGLPNGVVAGTQWRSEEQWRTGERPGILRERFAIMRTFVPAVGARPHPSTAQAIRRAVLPELVLGVPGLRPWDFRLADLAVLQDLGGALCPMMPTIGMAFASYAAEAHRCHLAASSSAPSKAVARIRGDVVATFERAAPKCCWDSLRTIAENLARNGGAAELCLAWGVSQAAIKALAAGLPEYPDLGSQRATALRYTLAGLM